MLAASRTNSIKVERDMTMYIAAVLLQSLLLLGFTGGFTSKPMVLGRGGGRIASLMSLPGTDYGIDSPASLSWFDQWYPVLPLTCLTIAQSRSRRPSWITILSYGETHKATCRFSKIRAHTGGHHCQLVSSAATGAISHVGITDTSSIPKELVPRFP